MNVATGQSVLKVCLFTDIVGSTDLKQRIGDARSAAMIAQHDAMFRAGMARFNGREELNPGDGFFVTFDVPSDALRCALYFQEGLRRLETAERLTARVGLHMGEILQIREPGEDGRAKLLGLAVDTAARVMSLAQPEQILLTRHLFDSVRQQVQSSPDGAAVEWRAHGPYVLKGLDEPIEVFEAGIDGLSPLAPPPSSEKAARTLAPGEEAVLGWRPAVGLGVPGREGWTLEAKLGEGGFGEVWLARHHRTRDGRAFKFCFQADRLRTLKRELTLFRLLKEVLGEREDIARLYEVQLDEAPYFLEMEYTSGGSFSEWAAGQGGLPAIPMALRLEIVAQIADALAAAHSVGVIHKDVKPANVLIHPKRDGAQARLTDFGIGQLLTTDLLEKAGITITGFDRKDAAGMTDLGSRTGTRLYMAPELLAGRTPSIRSDIFALGVLLYQTVVGDFGRPLAQGWETDIPDELLREDIAVCVAGDVQTRLPAADVLALRLRTLDARRAAREAARRREADEARRRRLVRGLVAALPIVIAAAIGGSLLWVQRAQLRQAKARAVVSRLITDFEGACAAAAALPRGDITEILEAGVRSPAYTDRITAARGAALFAPDAFWQSVDGGPLWQHGEWLEWADLLASPPAAPMPPVDLRAGAAGGRSPTSRYVVACLLGAGADRFRAASEWSQQCLKWAADDPDPAVVSAAAWAARRLGSESPPPKGDSFLMDPVSGMTFTRLPAAADFRPGSPAEEPDRYADEEVPAKGAAISSLWMATTETTLAAFRPFLEQETLPESRRAVIRARLDAVPAAQHSVIAVHTVSPIDAQNFCEWLTRQAAARGVKRRYRLPTEREWEYACRAGHGAAFCYGRDSRYLRHFAVADGREDEAGFRVATKMPNAYGLFDMHGNVWEICDSAYLPRYDDSGVAADQRLTVTRGGANYSPAARCRCAQRNYIQVDVPSDRTGFRLVTEPAD